MERYGSLDDFNEALEERRFLDEREQRRQSRRGPYSDRTGGTASPNSAGMRTPDNVGRRFMFSGNAEDGSSRPSSRASFRRPGETDDNAQTPGGGGSRLGQLRRSESGTPQMTSSSLPGSAGSGKVSTPIPSVFTPQNLSRKGSGYPLPGENAGQATTSTPPMSTEALNKLQAKVLRAKLMDDPDAVYLEEEYEKQRAIAENGGGDQGGAGLWEGASGGMQGQMGREVDENGTRVEVQVLPTLDGRGQLYDVGTGKQDEEIRGGGNRRKKTEKVSHCSLISRIGIEI